MKKYWKIIFPTVLASFVFYGGYSLTASLFPLMSKNLFDHYEKGFPYLVRLLGVFALLVVFNTLFEYLNRVYEWKVTQKFTVSLKQDLFASFIAKNPEDFQKMAPVDYLSILNNNVEALYEDNISATVDLIKSVLNLVIFAGSMLYVLDGRLTLLIMVFSAGISFLPLLTQKRLAHLRKINLNSQQDYNHVLLDLLSGYKYVSRKTVKTIEKRHQTSLTNAAEKRFNFGRFRVLSDMVNSVGTNLMNLCVFLVAGLLLIRGELTLGAASAALLYTGELIGSIGNILSCVNVLNSSKEVVTEVKADLKLPELPFDDAEIPDVTNFSVEKLTFQREDYVLQGENLNFSKEHSYAIVGASGAGKSTFLRLLNGEISSAESRFTLDEKEASEMKRRQQIFMLQQKEHLFETDLLNNLTIFGSFPLRVEVKNLLAKLPRNMRQRLENYQTITELSGGEGQVLSILRMVNLNYPINLLDEPFSGVDEKAKEIILTELLTQNQHILVEVTHDVSENNLKRYDEVLEVKAGGIAKR